MSSTIIIRPATIDDVSSMAAVDFTASADHPIVTLPWSTLGAGMPVWESRVRDFVEKKSRYLSYVAVTSSGEVVGQFVGTWPKDQWKQEDNWEWEPQLPEGANEAFFTYFLGRVKGEHAKFSRDDTFELESLSISPDYQRRGIGNMFIERWFHDTNLLASGKNAFVFSSAKGKGLYERFGWKVVNELVVPLDEFTGTRKDHVNWSMVREATVVKSI